MALAIAVGAALAAAWLFLHSRHFPAGEVDSKAAPAHAVDLPQAVGPNGIDYYGKLRLDIYIGADGTVDRIDTSGTTVPERLRQDAVRAFSTVAWEPARKWGFKVASVKRIEVDFEPPAGGPGTAKLNPAGQ